MKVKLVKTALAQVPKYQTEGSAGFDLHSVEEKTLKPGEISLVKTGLHTALPLGTELQVRPRSGLALKHGITVLNSPGTVDSDFVGEIGVILINHSEKTYTINKGDRIAQGILSRYEHAEFEEVESLDETTRTGGFGSTNK